MPVIAKALLWLLALLGLVLSFPLRQRLGLLYALFLSHLLFTMMFFAYERYLLPLLPTLTIMAAYGLYMCKQTWSALKNKPWKANFSTTSKVALVSIILLVANWGWDTARNFNALRAWQNVESLTDCDRGKRFEECYQATPTSPTH